MRKLFKIAASDHDVGEVIFKWQPEGNLLATAGANDMEEERQKRVQKARQVKASLLTAAVANNEPTPAMIPALNAELKVQAPPLMRLVRDEEPLGAAAASPPPSDNTSTISEPFSNSGSLRATHRKGAPMDAKEWFAHEERKAITAFIKDRELEVVVVLEGTDTCTGNSVQCRYSYSVDNMVWDHTIAPCVTKDEHGKCVIDFSRFHDTRPAPPDCLDAGFVQSYA